jgi:predicted dehydrogenase
VVRWGILGTGEIAALFATDLALADDATAAAVGSRSGARADAFGARFGIPSRYGSYEALVGAADVDVVYVATPAPAHRDAVLLALSAGKPVLCEKPFAMSADEAREMVGAARAAGVFLMEAMWTRFLPHIVRLRELLAGGALGEVRLVQADHGQRLPPDHRVFARELGGGALLDLGIYPVSLASMVLGTPTRVAAMSEPATTGVDAQTSVLLHHESGAHAVLTSTLEVRTPTTATIAGTEARVEIESVWYKPSAFTLVRQDGPSERFASPQRGRGMFYEAEEVARCLREGRVESDVMPLDETISIAATMDEIRVLTA